LFDKENVFFYSDYDIKLKLFSEKIFHSTELKGGGSLSAGGCLYFILDLKWSKFGTDFHKGPTKTKEEKNPTFSCLPLCNDAKIFNVHTDIKGLI